MNPVTIITSLLGLFSKTDAGAKVGAGISYVGVGAALAPVAVLAFKHKDEVLTCLTIGNAALMGSIIAAVVLVARGTRKEGG